LWYKFLILFCVLSKCKFNCHFIVRNFTAMKLLHVLNWFPLRIKKTCFIVPFINNNFPSITVRLILKQTPCLTSFKPVFLNQRAATRHRESILWTFYEQLLQTKITKAQKGSQVVNLFCAFGSACKKAARKTLIKLTLGWETFAQKNTIW